MTTYLRNAWYVAGFSDEVNTDQPLLARRLLDEPIVFFRTEDGEIRALQDRCPHRFVPLSGGKLIGGALQCPYHGLRFDGSGHCTLNPHVGGIIPKGAKVTAYVAADRHGLLWFWPGDPSLAKENLIPDLSFLIERSHPTVRVRGNLPTACNYLYLIDNVLDLTHADFLHAGALGAGVFSRQQPKLDDINERQLRISWSAGGAPAAQFFAQFLQEPNAAADQWMEASWQAPSIVTLRTGATIEGDPREAGVEALVMHIATPETTTTCHYWYWGTQSVELSPESLDQLHKMVRFAFEQQDKPILEAQQRACGNADFWSLKPVLLPGDAGAVRARRKLADLIDREGAPTRVVENTS